MLFLPQSDTKGMFALSFSAEHFCDIVPLLFVPILVFEIYLFLLVKFNYNAPVLLPVLLLFCMCQLLLCSVRMKRLREIHVKTEVCKSFDQPGDVGSSTHPHSPRTVGAWWGKRVRCPGREQEMNFLVYAKLVIYLLNLFGGLTS